MEQGEGRVWGSCSRHAYSLFRRHQKAAHLEGCGILSKRAACVSLPWFYSLQGVQGISHTAPPAPAMHFATLNSLAIWALLWLYVLQGVQGISDIITIPGLVNVDFADVKVGSF